MRTTMKLLTAAALATFCTGAISAQEDTVVVQKETIIQHDTVVREVPKDNKNYNKPPLRHGEIGVRYMPTFARLGLRSYNGDIIQGDVTFSNGYAFMLAGNFSPHFGIQGELNYLGFSQKYRDQNLDRQVDVSYLNIPILLSFNTNKERIVNWNFVVGPQFGVNLGASVKTTGNSYGETQTGSAQATIGASGTDVGAAYGTGLEIALNRMHTARLDFGYRGFYGIVNGDAKQTNNSNNTSTYNIYVKGSRMTNAAYVGLTWCF